MTQQFSTGMVERRTKTAVSDDNSRDVTPCCLPKQQSLSNHFRTFFIHLQMLTDVADTFYAYNS